MPVWKGYVHPKVFMWVTDVGARAILRRDGSDNSGMHMSGGADSSGQKQRKGKARIVLWLLVLVVLACTWDMVLAKGLFYYACNAGKGVGHFIYEPVVLDRSYFSEIPPHSDLTKIDPRFISSGNKILEKSRFDDDYRYQFYEQTLWSKVGPIFRYRSSVIRLSDNKLLGESISYRNYRGWLVDLVTMDGNPSVECPSEKAMDGVGSKIWKLRWQLVQLVFSVGE